MKEVEPELTEFKGIFSSDALYHYNERELLAKARKFAKIESEYANKYREDLTPKKIAVLASYTSHHLIGVLRLFFYKHGISPEYYVGEYDSIAMDILDPNSQLYEFHPDILLLLTHNKDICKYPGLFAKADEVEQWTDEHVKYYESLWTAISKINGCQVFQTNFILPMYRALGNLSANSIASPQYCIQNLNLKLTACKPKFVTFIDMEYLASYEGKKNWFDDTGYYLSKQGFSFQVYPAVCDYVSKVIVNSIKQLKKVLVVDLDNTLWGGVIGDDGLEGINLSSTNGVGEAYIAFQHYIKELKSRGVLLAVCSKNNDETAKLPFTDHPEMVLSLSDISCFVANWDDKATNIRRICSTLNIGTDSAVFFDDSSFERNVVKKILPEVEVIDVPQDPALYIRVLDESRCFEWTQLTEEDTLRTESFIADNKRREVEQNSGDYETYLQNLEMVAEVGPVSPIDVSRFTQLINKSNQFNLRTQRYTEAVIADMCAKPDEYSLIDVSLSDKFGKYGIISCIILRKTGNVAFIDTWVMSCRVLKRGVEDIVFNAIAEAAEKWGCAKIMGEYIPTKKNAMVKGLLASFGFSHSDDSSIIKSDVEGSELFEYNLNGLQKKSTYISVETKKVA